MHLLSHIRKPNQLITDALNEIKNIKPTIGTSTYDTTKFEALWNRIAQEQKHVLMERANMLYSKYLRQARQIERNIRVRKDRYEDSILTPILRIPPSEMRYTDALIVSMRHKYAKAIYFAHDACVAEGALFYTGVDQYNNHADLSFVKNRRVRANLITNNQLYQSINEQYAGFLKDIKHYSCENNNDGRVIYRSSKYLFRLLNTIIDSGRHRWNRMRFEHNEDTKSLKTMLEELLLPIRKSKYPFDGLSAIYRAQISECFALAIFATDSQLEKYWQYRRSTLDQSNTLSKYKDQQWEFIRTSNYTSEVKHLLVNDLKASAVQLRENNSNGDIFLNIKVLLTVDRPEDSYVVIDMDTDSHYESALSVLPEKPSILTQYKSSVNQIFINCKEKICHNYFRGTLDHVPDIVRYLFDWNISRFNIVTKYPRREEYRRVKQSKVYDYITFKDYFVGIMLGIILACIQMFLIAPIMFLTKPINKSIWILRTLCKLHQPSDRIFLNMRAAHRTLIT
ncbi:unnamed protein product, partial [Adineta ricciae]